MRILYAILFVLAMLVLQAVLFYLANVFGVVQSYEEASFGIQVIIDIVFLVSAIFIWRYFARHKQRNALFYTKKSIMLSVIYTLLLVVIFVGARCFYFSSFLSCDYGQMLDFTWNVNAKVEYYLWRTVLIVPILEELIFRKYITNYIATTPQKLPIAIIVSSVLFALSHTILDAFLFYFLSGILLSLIYQSSKTIIWPIILHAVFNLLVYVFA